MLAIIEDTKQKIGKHLNILNFFQSVGINVRRCGLPYGDYIKAPEVSVDTKQNIEEIAYNMCGRATEKHRFASECNDAKDDGCKLYFLIEDKRFTEISDLYGKQIHLRNGITIPGDQLATAMGTMSGRYGCEFVFCDPNESGRKIIELLESKNGE